MAARKAWFKLSKKLPTWALSRKLEGQIATAVVGETLVFGCEVRGFSNKEEKEYETLWSRVVFGITRQKREDLERDEKTLADLRISCKLKPILDLIQIRQLNYHVGKSAPKEHSPPSVHGSGTPGTRRNAQQVADRLGNTRGQYDELEKIMKRVSQ